MKMSESSFDLTEVVFLAPISGWPSSAAAVVPMFHFPRQRIQRQMMPEIRIMQEVAKQALSKILDSPLAQLQ